jgi:hypothetical protein
MKGCSTQLKAFEDGSAFESFSELRESPRFSHSSAIIFESYWSREHHIGRMVNFSHGGICFITDKTPTIGSEIFIGIDKSPYSSAHDVFRTKVVWVQELPIHLSHYPYAVGVRFC